MGSEKITVLSVMSTDTTVEASRTNFISSSRISTPDPAQSTMSPDIPTRITTRLSTSPILTESIAISMATETVLPGATSQGTRTTDDSATATWAEGHSAGTQDFARSDGTTSMDTGSEDESRTSPSSDQDITSPSSHGPSRATMPPSLASPTSQASNLSASVPVTSPDAAGTLGTAGLLNRSLGPGTSSSDLSSSSAETRVISEATTTREGLHPSGNTAVTNVGTTTSALESQSSAPVRSETHTDTTPLITSSFSEDSTVSAPMADLSKTTDFGTQSISSLGAKPWESSTSRPTNMGSEKITVLSVMSTDTTVEASRTDFISSSRISTPDPAQSTMSPDIPTRITTRLSTSPILTESIAISMATETVLPGATSQGTRTTDDSATATWAEGHSAGTQDFARSDGTTSMDTGSEDESRTSPSSAQDVTSPSSHGPSRATMPPSVDSPKSQALEFSAPVPGTSPGATGTLGTTGPVSTVLGPVTTESPSDVSSTSAETPVISEATTATEEHHPSGNTAVTNVLTITSALISQSSAPVSSETHTDTTPFITSSFSGDSMISTPMADLSKTTDFRTQSKSSLGAEQWDNGTSRSTVMDSEKTTVLSIMSTDMSAEVSRTDVISSRRTSSPDPAQSTMSPSIPTGNTTRLSTVPVLTDSTAITMATETVLPGATSQGTRTTDASATASWAESHSAGTQGFAGSDGTTSTDTGSEDESRTSPSSAQDVTSISSHGPSRALMPPSLASPTSQDRDLSVSVPVTSPVAAGMLGTTGPLRATFEPGTSSASDLSSTSVKTPVISKATTTTEGHHPSGNTSVTNVGTIAPTQKSQPSAPANSETTKGIIPIVISSVTGDTTVSTPVDGLSETTELVTQSKSSLGTEEWDASTSRLAIIRSEKITVPSVMSTDTSVEASRTDVISSSRTSTPDPAQSTMSQDMQTGFNTRLSTSPVQTESIAISMATETVLPGPTLQGTRTTDASATASWAESHSAGMQGFARSNGRTSMDTGSEDESRTSPSSDQDITSPSSHGPSRATMPPSLASPTSQASDLSAPVPITSPDPVGTLGTAGPLSRSLGPRTSSPSDLSSSSAETRVISEATTTREGLLPSGNTAVTNVGTITSALETQSSAPVGSETHTDTTPFITSSFSGDSTVSAPMADLSKTTDFGTQSISSLGAKPWESSTSRPTNMGSEKITVLSVMSTDTTVEASRTDFISSSRISTPDPAQSTMSPDIPTRITTRLSTSPILTESIAISMATETVLPGATSQGTRITDDSTTDFWAESLSAGTQGFARSDGTTRMDMGSEDESRTSPSSAQDVTSPSSHGPSRATMPPSLASPTSQDSDLSAPVPITSPDPVGTLGTAGPLSRSLGPRTSSPSDLSSSSAETRVISEATTTREGLLPSGNTAVTNVGTITSALETQSSAPVGSETHTDTTPFITSSFSGDSTVSTPMADLSKTTDFGIQSISSLGAKPWESSTSRPTNMGSEKITVLSVMSTDTTVEASRTDFISSSRISTPDPAQSTMSPDIPTRITTRLSTSPILTESIAISMATETVLPGATSQGTRITDDSTTDFWAESLSAGTQGFARSDGTTRMDMGSEDESRTSPSSAQDVTSPSSHGPSRATMPPSLASPTSQDRDLSVPLLVTSPAAAGTLGTAGPLSTSLGPETNSPSDVSSTSAETLVISEASTATEGQHPSRNTAVTNVGTITSAVESQSSAPTHSETPEGTTPFVTSSPTVDSIVSTALAGLPETTELETQSTSTLGTEQWDSSTSRRTVMDSEIITAPSVMSTDRTMEASRTDIISSSRTSTPGPAQSTMSPDIPTGFDTRLSTSPVLTESTAISMATETVLPGALSQGTHAQDGSATASWTESHLAGTLGFAGSDGTTIMDTSSEAVSRTSPSSDQDITSSSHGPSRATTPPSLASPTSQARDLSASVPITSPAAAGTLGTAGPLSTSLSSGTSSPSDLSSTSAETQVISEASMITERLHSSGNTAVTNVGTITSALESQSSAPAGSETHMDTTPIVSTSPTVDSIVSTALAGLPETTELTTQSTSSLGAKQWDSSTSRPMVMGSEKITIPSVMSTDTSAEVSRTDDISSSKTSSPVPAQSTMSKDIPTGNTTRLSTSPFLTESTAITMATETVLPGATLQGTRTMDASATASWAESHSAGTQGFVRSDGTTHMDTGFEDESRTSPSSAQDVTSPSSHGPSRATTPPSLASPTSQATDLSAPVLVTSPVAAGMLGTASPQSTSQGPGTRSPSALISTSAETPVISKATTTIEGHHPSRNTAVTNMGTITSAQKSQSSPTVVSETPKGTIAIVIHSVTGDTTVSTPVDGLSETTELVTQSKSSLGTEEWVKSTSRPAIIRSEKITVPSVMSTDTSVEASRTDVISSSRTSTPDPAQSTMSQDMQTGFNTRLSTSPVQTESIAISMATETVLPGPTLQGTRTTDASATASWAESHSAGTQGFARSNGRTSMDTGSEDESRTSPSSDQDITSPSSHGPSRAMMPPSLASPTSQDRDLSVSVPVTSPVAAGMLGTTGPLRATFEPGTSSASDLSSTSVKTPVISKATTTTEGHHPSGNTFRDTVNLIPWCKAMGKQYLLAHQYGLGENHCPFCNVH
ncbi:mucin-16-like [Ailuropoda melanoleuca]|uniref:mucin-16-like n=1 Tax=Ailuropoda melanoleuca TaxID=9646 RepID=UPI0014944784|nr:mucin-16-like [Ailuropoda melanoleuca]